MRVVWSVGLVLLIALGVFIHHTSTFRPAKNFHEIDPGRFYRSAQLAKDEFDEIVKQYGIKTVINLRGTQPGEWWYDDEKSELKRLGVRMEDIGFSTEHVQTKQDWARYLELLKNAPRPILVHCRSGADRTGEATAVYSMEYMGKSKDEALDYVSLKYLHVGLFHPAKRAFVRAYQGQEWALKLYDPCAKEFRGYSKRESNCDAVTEAHAPVVVPPAKKSSEPSDSPSAEKSTTGPEVKSSRELNAASNA